MNPIPPTLSPVPPPDVGPAMQWVVDTLLSLGLAGISGETAWPRTDEARMRELGQAWMQFADALGASMEELNQSAGDITSAYGGDAGIAFATSWMDVAGAGDTSAFAVANNAFQVGFSAENTAMMTEYTRLSMQLNIIITVASIIIAKAMAFITAGASEAAVPGLLASGHAAVLAAYHAFRQGVQTVGVRAAVASAMRLGGRTLVGAMTSQGVRSQVTSQAFSRFSAQGARTMGRAALAEIGEELVIDLVAQGIQIQRGHRDGWDTDQIALATIGGGVGGAFGVLAFGDQYFDGFLTPVIRNRHSQQFLSDGSVLRNTAYSTAAGGLQNVVINGFGNISATGLVYGWDAIAPAFANPAAFASTYFDSWQTSAANGGLRAGGGTMAHGVGTRLSPMQTIHVGPELVIIAPKPGSFLAPNAASLTFAIAGAGGGPQLATPSPWTPDRFPGLAPAAQPLTTADPMLSGVAQSGRADGGGIGPDVSGSFDQLVTNLTDLPGNLRDAATRTIDAAVDYHSRAGELYQKLHDAGLSWSEARVLLGEAGAHSPELTDGTGRVDPETILSAMPDVERAEISRDLRRLGDLHSDWEQRLGTLAELIAAPAGSTASPAVAAAIVATLNAGADAADSVGADQISHHRHVAELWTAVGQAEVTARAAALEHSGQLWGLSADAPAAIADSYANAVAELDAAVRANVAQLATASTVLAGVRLAADLTTHRDRVLTNLGGLADRLEVRRTSEAIDQLALRVRPVDGGRARDVVIHLSGALETNPPPRSDSDGTAHVGVAVTASPEAMMSSVVDGLRTVLGDAGVSGPVESSNEDIDLRRLPGAGSIVNLHQADVREGQIGDVRGQADGPDAPAGSALDEGESPAHPIVDMIRALHDLDDDIHGVRGQQLRHSIVEAVRDRVESSGAGRSGPRTAAVLDKLDSTLASVLAEARAMRRLASLRSELAEVTAGPLLIDAIARNASTFENSASPSGRLPTDLVDHLVTASPKVADAVERLISHAHERAADMAKLAELLGGHGEPAGTDASFTPVASVAEEAARLTWLTLLHRSAAETLTALNQVPSPRDLTRALQEARRDLDHQRVRGGHRAPDLSAILGGTQPPAVQLTTATIVLRPLVADLEGRLSHSAEILDLAVGTVPDDGWSSTTVAQWVDAVGEAIASPRAEDAPAAVDGILAAMAPLLSEQVRRAFEPALTFQVEHDRLSAALTTFRYSPPHNPEHNGTAATWDLESWRSQSSDLTPDDHPLVATALAQLATVRDGLAEAKAALATAIATERAALEPTGAKLAGAVLNRLEAASAQNRSLVPWQSLLEHRGVDAGTAAPIRTRIFKQAHEDVARTDQRRGLTPEAPDSSAKDVLDWLRRADPAAAGRLSEVEAEVASLTEGVLAHTREAIIARRGLLAAAARRFADSGLWLAGAAPTVASPVARSDPRHQLLRLVSAVGVTPDTSSRGHPTIAVGQLQPGISQSLPDLVRTYLTVRGRPQAVQVGDLLAGYLGAELTLLAGAGADRDAIAKLSSTFQNAVRAFVAAEAARSDIEDQLGRRDLPLNTFTAPSLQAQENAGFSQLRQLAADLQVAPAGALGDQSTLIAGLALDLANWIRAEIWSNRLEATGKEMMATGRVDLTAADRLREASLVSAQNERRSVLAHALLRERLARGEDDRPDGGPPAVPPRQPRTSPAAQQRLPSTPERAADDIDGYRGDTIDPRIDPGQLPQASTPALVGAAPTLSPEPIRAVHEEGNAGQGGSAPGGPAQGGSSAQTPPAAGPAGNNEPGAAGGGQSGSGGGGQQPSAGHHAPPPRPSLAALIPVSAEAALANRSEIEAGLMAALSATTFGGLTIAPRLHDDSTVNWTIEPNLIIARLDIFDGATGGLRVGTATVEFARREDGTLHGEFIRVDLRPAAQGRGFLTSFVEYIAHWAEESGLSHLDVDTGDDIGGYAWSRLGFDFKRDTQHQVRVILQALESQRHALASDPDAASELSAVDAILDRTRRYELGDPSFPSADEISQAGRGDTQGRAASWPGKRAMLGANYAARRVLDPVVAPDPAPIATAPPPKAEPVGANRLAPQAVTNTPELLAQVADGLDAARPDIDAALAGNQPVRLVDQNAVVYTPRRGKPVQVTVLVDPRLADDGARVEVLTDHLGRIVSRRLAPQATLLVSESVANDPERLAEQVVGAVEHVRHSHRHGVQDSSYTDPNSAPKKRGKPSAADLGRLAALDVARAHHAGQDAVLRHLAELGVLDQDASARRRLHVLHDLLQSKDPDGTLGRMVFNTRRVEDGSAVFATLDRAVRAAAEHFTGDHVQGAAILDRDAAEPQLAIKVDGNVVHVPVKIVDPGRRDFAVRLHTEDGSAALQIRSDASDIAIAVDAAGAVARLSARQHEGQRASSPDTQQVEFVPALADDHAQLEVLKKAYERASVEERLLIRNEVDARDLQWLRYHADQEAFFRKVDQARGLSVARAGKNLPFFADQQTPQLAWPHYFRRFVSASASSMNTAVVGVFAGRPLYSILSSVGSTSAGNLGQATADWILGVRLPEATLTAAADLGPQSPDRWVNPVDNTPLRDNIIKRVPYAALSGLASGAILVSFVGPVFAFAGGAISTVAALGQSFMDKFADPYEKNAVARRKALEALEPDSRRNRAVQAFRYHAEILAEQSVDDAAARARLQQALEAAEELRASMEPEVDSKLGDMQRDRHPRLLVAVYNKTFAQLPGLERLPVIPPPAGDTYTLHILGSGRAGSWYNEVRVGVQQPLMQIPSWAISLMKAKTLDALVGSLASINTANAAGAIGRGSLYGFFWSILTEKQAAAATALAAFDARHNVTSAIQSLQYALDTASPPHAPRKPASTVREQKAADEAIGRPRSDSRLFQSYKHVGGALGSLAGSSWYWAGATYGLHTPAGPTTAVLGAAYVTAQVAYTAGYALAEGIQRIRPHYAERAYTDAELLKQARSLPVDIGARMTEIAELLSVAQEAQGDITPMPRPEKPSLSERLGVAKEDRHRLVDAARDATHRSPHQPVLLPGPIEDNDSGSMRLRHADRRSVDRLANLINDTMHAFGEGRRPVGMSQPEVLLGELRLLLESHGLLSDQAGGDERWSTVRETMQRRHGLDPDQVNVLRLPQTDWSAAWPAQWSGVVDPEQVTHWLATVRQQDPLRLPLITAIDHLQRSGLTSSERLVQLESPGVLRIVDDDRTRYVRIEVGAVLPGNDAELRAAIDRAGRPAADANRRTTASPHEVRISQDVAEDPTRLAAVLDEVMNQLAAFDGNRLRSPQPSHYALRRPGIGES